MNNKLRDIQILPDRRGRSYLRLDRISFQLLIIIYLTLVFAHAAATPEPLILRSSVTPEKPWVGQKVVMNVDILASDGWAQLKKVSNTEIKGAYLLQLQTQGTRLSETMEGQTYSGQRYEFLLFAQRSGQITVPPVPVDVEIKSWGTGAETQTKRMTIPAVELIARFPPGAEGIHGLISTTRFTANQQWDPQPDNPKAGDAIKRTVRLEASDVSGMAFAPMQYPQTEGLGIYLGEPTVDDAYERGSLTGARIETVTYVFERPGEIEIPGVALAWWDTEAEELKKIDLPGLTLQVVYSPAGESLSGTKERQKYPMLVVALLLAVVVIASIVLLRHRNSLTERWKAWRKAISETEAMSFRRVKKSVRSGDPKAVLRATMQWLDRINVDPQPARLDQFLRQYGDVRVQEAANRLLGNLDPGREKEDISILGSGLAAARNRWRKAQRRKRQPSALLPELNSPQRYAHDDRA